MNKQTNKNKSIEDIIAREFEAKKEARIHKENESLAFAEQRINQVLPELIITGQLIELCFELLPETLRISTMNENISNIYVQNSYDYLKNFFYAQKIYNLKNGTGADEPKINPLTEIIPYLFKNLSEFGKGYFGKRGDWAHVNKLIKKKQYTHSLVNIIFLIGDLGSFEYYFNKKINFQEFSLIGQLFVDMGAINSALKLYEINPNFFRDPNTLNLLANNAIKLGKLEWAVKLIDQLITQEPYHPSITVLQADVKRLEQRSRLKSTLSIDFSEIEQLSGIEFENLLLDKFITLGFKAESTPKTGDFGADLIVENSEGSRIIVQCKRFKSKVNLKAVQEVVGAMGHYAGDYGVVITNSSFLNSAIKLAESHDIELWGGDKLVSFLAGDLSFSEVTP